MVSKKLKTTSQSTASVESNNDSQDDSKKLKSADVREVESGTGIASTSSKITTAQKSATTSNSNSRHSSSQMVSSSKMEKFESSSSSKSVTAQSGSTRRINKQDERAEYSQHSELTSHSKEQLMTLSDYSSSGQIISSLDLLESDNKEPIFSVPIDVIELPDHGKMYSSSTSSALSSNARTATTTTTKNHSEYQNQRQRQSNSSMKISSASQKNSSQSTQRIHSNVGISLDSNNHQIYYQPDAVEIVLENDRASLDQVHQRERQLIEEITKHASKMTSSVLSSTASSTSMSTATAPAATIAERATRELSNQFIMNESLNDKRSITQQINNSNGTVSTDITEVDTYNHNDDYVQLPSDNVEILIPTQNVTSLPQSIQSTQSARTRQTEMMSSLSKTTKVAQTIQSSHLHDKDDVMNGVVTTNTTTNTPTIPVATTYNGTINNTNVTTPSSLTSYERNDLNNQNFSKTNINDVNKVTTTVIDTKNVKNLHENKTRRTSTLSEIVEKEKTTKESANKKSQAISKKEVYDVKTKTWCEYREGNVANKKHPSFERIVSRETDGTYKITYKKKIYDQRNNKWRIVEERTVDNTYDLGYPEIVDDVINTTTTTYTTKVYDSKLGKWKIVDEKSYVDAKASVPQDIVREIEKDNTDVANITTTTEITKIYDASINDWRVLDEKIRTDVLEKIVEPPKKTVYIDEYVEIEKNAKLLEDIENVEFNLNKISKSKDITENIYDEINEEKYSASRKTIDSRTHGIDKKRTIGIQRLPHAEMCICEICTCGRHHCTTTEAIKKTSKELQSDSTDVVDNVETRRIRTNTWSKSDLKNEELTINTDSRKLTEETTNEQTAYDIIINTKSLRPQDHLKPEGEFYVPQKLQYIPAERRIPTKPVDNLKAEGEFYTSEHQENFIEINDLRLKNQKTTVEEEIYSYSSRPKQIKATDNLKPEGELYIPAKQGYKHSERPMQKKPIDNLKPEGQFYTPDKPHFSPGERSKPVRHDDNLKPEGEFYSPERPKYKPAERPTQKKPEDNLKPEGEFYTPDKPQFSPGERPKPVRHDDNLKPEGEFYSPEKPGYKPAERPTQKKPEDNLKPEGEFYEPVKPKYVSTDRPTPVKIEDNLRCEGNIYIVEKPKYVSAVRPTQAKPKDNLKIEGDFTIPDKPVYVSAEKTERIFHVDNLRMEDDITFIEKQKFTNIEKQKSIKKPVDKLKPEGHLHLPDKPKFLTVKRPLPIRPKDNLKPEGEFCVPEKPTYETSEKITRIIRKDNLKMEGEMSFIDNKQYHYIEKRQPIKHADNLKPEGVFYSPERVSYKPTERPIAKKPKDNLKLEGDFESPKKPCYKPGERPIIKKPTDNLKPEGDFVMPDKPKFKSGDRPKSVRPVDNLKPEGEFYKPEKPISPKGVVDKVSPKRPVDNLKLEGTMEIVKKNEMDKQTIKQTSIVRQTKTKSTHNSSSIKLGSDSSILKTTSQMTYASGKTAVPVGDINAEKPADGMVIVETKQVTTVIGGKTKKEPKTEYIKRQGAINIVESIEKSKTAKNIKNVENVYNENVSLTQNHATYKNKIVRAIETDEAKSAITSINNKSVKKHSSESDHSHGVFQFHQYHNDVSERNKLITNENDSRATDTLYKKQLTSNNITNITSKTNEIQCRSSQEISDSNISILKSTSLDNFAKSETTGSSVLHSHVTHAENMSNISQSSNLDKQFHHRKTEFSSEADVSNAILHRKNVSSESLQFGGGLSTNGKIQRRSILNLNEQPSSSSSWLSGERQSYSSMHRQKDIDSLSSERRTYSSIHHENKEYSSSSIKHHHHRISSGIDFPSYSRDADRIITRQRANQSSILLGSDSIRTNTKISSNINGHKGANDRHSSLYQIEYKTIPVTTCAVHKIKQGAFQHTRDTQEHKYFKTITTDIKK